MVINNSANNGNTVTFKTLTKAMRNDLSQFIKGLSQTTYCDATNISRRSFVSTIYRLINVKTIVIVGRKTEGIVSFGMLTVSRSLNSQHNRSALVSGLVVKTELQGKGLGTATLNRLLTVAKQKGCKKARLIALKRNVKVVAFYEKRGFKITCEKLILPLDDDVGAIEVYEMEKPLMHL